jgi:hypothetical protein
MRWLRKRRERRFYRAISPDKLHKLLYPGVYHRLQYQGLAESDPRVVPLAKAGTKALADAMCAGDVLRGEELTFVDKWLCRLDPEQAPLRG